MCIVVGFSMACSRSGGSADSLSADASITSMTFQCPVSGFQPVYSDFIASINIEKH
jgi:hypothetical protein